MSEASLTKAVTAIDRMVESCRLGKNPAMVMRMASGWAVMGSPQVLKGYCVLLPDPVVPHLNEMTAEHRTHFLADMAKLGDAVMATTDAVRINYAIFGNLEPALHAHVIPRFESEAEEMRTQTPWSYDWSAAPPFDANEAQGLIQSMREYLTQD